MNSYPWIINSIYKVRSVPWYVVSVKSRRNRRASRPCLPPVHASVSSSEESPLKIGKKRKTSSFQPDRECERVRRRPPYFPLGHFLCGIKHFAERGKCVGIPNGRTEEGGGFRHCGRRQNCEARAFPALVATEEIKDRGRLDISEQNFFPGHSFGRCGSRS